MGSLLTKDGAKYTTKWERPGWGGGVLGGCGLTLGFVDFDAAVLRLGGGVAVGIDVG